jgi:hypothetical protein
LLFFQQKKFGEILAGKTRPGFFVREKKSTRINFRVWGEKAGQKAEMKPEGRMNAGKSSLKGDDEQERSDCE